VFIHEYEVKILEEKNIKLNATGEKRCWKIIILKIIINYLILSVGIIIGVNYFFEALFLIPLISFGINYFSVKDRYELYVLNTSLLIFSALIFVIALFSNGDIEQSAFAIVLSAIGILEFAIITLVLNKIKQITESKIIELSNDELEKIQLGMLGAKIAIVMIFVFFVLSCI